MAKASVPSATPEPAPGASKVVKVPEDEREKLSTVSLEVR